MTIHRKAGIAAAIPPHAWFVVSALFHYIGPSLAVVLFPSIGVFGVAWLRIMSAALLFAAWSNPWQTFRTTDRLTRRHMLALGICLGVMNTVFYLALDRLPMSLVAAIEFVGALALAAYGLRTGRNYVALALCLFGVALLVDLKWKSDPLGLAWALLNGGLFVIYVLLGHRLSQQGANAGIRSLGSALAVAAFVVMPLGLLHSAPLIRRPLLILAGAGVGVCSSMIPYVCDQMAMARLPRPSFALMLSLMPITAALCGAIVLRQIPTGRDLVGIILVVAGVAVHCPPETLQPETR